MATILIVDDKADEVTLTSALTQADAVEGANALHPEEVTLSDLSAADLVLVDYQLDDETWLERREGPIARQPRDGLALASVLRRHVHDADKASPTAFGILSSEVSKLAFPLPAHNRLHILARLNNLEWVFHKSTPGEEDRLVQQVVALATAVENLPSRWPKGDANDSALRLMTVLGLSEDCDDHAQLLDDVMICIPPIHEISEWSHGLSVVRWLLHRILPYPCFLWDSHHLAARLRVDHKWLQQALASNPRLRSWLQSAEYEGVLANFAGRRWWRGRIEQLLWDATEHQSFDVDAVYQAVVATCRGEVKRSGPPDHPYVCVNSDLAPLDDFADGKDCVRIRPDDWPPFADQARTTVQLARSEGSLGALVVSEDRGKLDA